MSGTVTSRELVYHKFRKRRDFLWEILPLPFGEFPNPPEKFYVRSDNFEGEKSTVEIQNNRKRKDSHRKQSQEMWLVGF